MNEPFNYIRVKDRIVNQESKMFDATYLKLEPAIYEVNLIKQGLFDSGTLSYIPVQDNKDLVRFSSGIIHNICTKVDSFLNKDTKEKYAKYNLAHKLGIILYGLAGTGKTSCAYLLFKQLVENHNAICLVAGSWNISYMIRNIKSIRQYQDNPIVIFFDEIDDHINNSETDWLTFLDGSDSIENVIVLGCTNYLSKIPERIKNRPSRIKLLYEIDRFPDAVYEEYIKAKISDITTEKLKEIVYKVGEAKFTIDQVKHVLIDHFIDSISIDDAIQSTQLIKSTSITSEENDDDIDF